MMAANWSSASVSSSAIGPRLPDSPFGTAVGVGMRVRESGVGDCGAVIKRCVEGDGALLPQLLLVYRTGRGLHGQSMTFPPRPLPGVVES